MLNNLANVIIRERLNPELSTSSSSQQLRRKSFDTLIAESNDLIAQAKIAVAKARNN